MSEIRVEVVKDAGNPVEIEKFSTDGEESRGSLARKKGYSGKAQKKKSGFVDLGDVIHLIWSDSRRNTIDSVVVNNLHGKTPRFLAQRLFSSIKKGSVIKVEINNPGCAEFVTELEGIIGSAEAMGEVGDRTNGTREFTKG